MRTNARAARRGWDTGDIPTSLLHPCHILNIPDIPDIPYIPDIPRIPPTSHKHPAHPYILRAAWLPSCLGSSGHALLAPCLWVTLCRCYVAAL